MLRLGIATSFALRATTLVSAAVGASKCSSSSSSISRASPPVIAVVAGEESLARIPPQDQVKFVRVNPTHLSSQSNILAEAEGLLWIPDPGSPSAPSDTLATVWPLLPKVRWVHSFAAGVDGLRPFIEKCLAPEAHRVTLTNGRGAFSSSLGEYALASMLYFNKQMGRISKNSIEQKWDYFIMDVMAHKTVGLVGYGSIGQSAGKAIKGAFPKCRILALRRTPRQGTESSGPADEEFGFDDRLDFFKQCDFVICSLPATPSTKHFIGRVEFSSMKDSAVLVSLGRGAVIDEEALADALDEGILGGAALDVFQSEPLPSSSRFWGRENVLITAHNADYTAVRIQLVFNQEMKI